MTLYLVLNGFDISISCGVNGWSDLNKLDGVNDTGDLDSS